MKSIKLREQAGAGQRVVQRVVRAVVRAMFLCNQVRSETPPHTRGCCRHVLESLLTHSCL